MARSNAIRWEAQLRDEPALTMVKRLLAAEGEWGAAMRTRFVNLVDFREAEGSNVSRRMRVPWYAQIMQGVERASCYLPEELRQFADLYEYYRSTHAQNIGSSGTS